MAHQLPSYCVDAHGMRRMHAPGRRYCRECWPPRGRGRGEAQYSPRRAQSLKRALEALRLQGQGWTYAAIARRLGYRTRGGAHRAVWRLIRGVNAQERARAQERAENERERRVRINAWCHDNGLIPPDWDAIDEGRDWLD